MKVTNDNIISVAGCIYDLANILPELNSLLRSTVAIDDKIDVAQFAIGMIQKYWDKLNEVCAEISGNGNG